MRSDVVKVTMLDIAPALDMVEKTAEYVGFPAEFGQKMRLMGEELVRSISFIMDDVDASLWVDTDDANMYIHLKLEGALSDTTREKLVNVSKEQRNEPPKGLFKRIGAFFSDAFMADTAGYVPLFIEGGDMSGSASYFLPLSMLADYEAPAQTEAHDDLAGIESNILKGLADDVTVCARTSYAELTVIKKLPKA